MRRTGFHEVTYCARDEMIMSSAVLPSCGMPNSTLFAYCAVPPSTPTMVGSVSVRVVPSAAVARNTALPAESARITPLASIDAIAGVSAAHVHVEGVLTASMASDAKSWSSKPTGSAASLGRRPEKLTSTTGTSELHAPKLAGIGPYHSRSERR